jgi:hypothetical protein
MKRCLILFLVVTLPVFGFDWPLDTLKVSATFGSNRGDHFHAGVDLAKGGEAVTPIAPGELLYSYDEGRDYSTLPVGLGSFMVLQHEGGILSLYCHLEAGSLERESLRFEGDQVLGVSGSSGSAQGALLHLSIIDSEMKTVLNPFLLLPAVTDNQAPRIRGLYIGDGSRLLELTEETGEIPLVGEVEVLAEVFDLREDVSFVSKFAPYQILLYQDGKEVTSLTFDSLTRETPDAAPSADQGRPPDGGGSMVTVSGKKSFTAVYDSSAEWLFRLGWVQLVPGETSLLLVARDFAGNESVKELQLRVAAGAP